MIEFIGSGSIKNLRKILKENNFLNVFYITSNSPLEQGNVDKVQSLIEKECQFFHFTDIAPTPTVEGVKKALNLFEKGKYDLIVGMGEALF